MLLYQISVLLVDQNKLLYIFILLTPVISLNRPCHLWCLALEREKNAASFKRSRLLSHCSTLENPALQFTYSLCPPTRDKASNLLTGPLSGCRSGSAEFYFLWTLAQRVKAEALNPVDLKE